GAVDDACESSAATHAYEDRASRGRPALTHSQQLVVLLAQACGDRCASHGMHAVDGDIPRHHAQCGQFWILARSSGSMTSEPCDCANCSCHRTPTSNRAAAWTVVTLPNSFCSSPTSTPRSEGAAAGTVHSA